MGVDLGRASFYTYMSMVLSISRQLLLPITLSYFLLVICDPLIVLKFLIKI